ncbi:MAG: hypothetical protein VW397_04140, partial [Candidatus Margulisiibacteriota bacterium]
MKIILTLFLISFYVTGADFTSIPKQYKNKIYLDEPKKNTITINDSLRIKGQVTKEIRVKINSEEIQLKNYQFDKSLKLSQLGKQNIIIEFLINEDRIILEREVIKLKDSKDEVLSQRQLAFINTNFTSNRFKQLPLQNALQKSEVAYFLDKININPSTETISILNAEKIKNHSSAIQNLVNSKVFNLNDNGDFNEFETMAKTTFLASISKALNLVPSGINYPALKEYKNAWFYNYLVIGFDQQLINKNDLKSIRKTMTNADFVRIASKIKLFENAIAKELT